MTSWFYLEDGRRVGPVSEPELAELFRSGRIAAGASVQAEGEETWSPLDERMFRVVGGPPPPQQNVPPPANSPWTDTSPHPWRRYFARTIDYSVIGSVVWLLMLFVAYSFFPEQEAETFERLLDGRGGQLIGIIVTIAAAAPINALSVGLTGFSLGKWIFGVKVVRPDGGRIGVKAAFGRELKVWLHGMGLGLPLVSLFTLIGSYQRLEAKRHTPWDRPSDRIVVHRPAGLVWTMIMAVAVLIWIGLNILGRMTS